MDVSKRVFALALMIFAFITVAGLYATGPKTKTVCHPGATVCALVRTNAWERIKGAVTASP